MGCRGLPGSPFHFKFSAMAYLVTSPPAIEPLSLEEAKLWLKVPDSMTADDDLIEGLVVEARQYVERVTGRALIAQTISDYWDAFPAAGDKFPRVLVLSVAPVLSLSDLSYLVNGASPGDYTVWDFDNFQVDQFSGVMGIGGARIVRNSGVSWPETADYPNAVRVEYEAGYGYAASDVPGPIRQAIKRLIGSWYYGRKGGWDEDFKMVQDLLNPYKVFK